MGGWKLEIAKVALYVTFPVALFHYFNQPEYFEEWVVKTKRELYPPETEAQKRFQEAMQELKQQEAQALMAALEENK